MVQLQDLATELLLAIAGFVEGPIAEYPSPDAYAPAAPPPPPASPPAPGAQPSPQPAPPPPPGPHHPPLKSLALTSRHFYTICAPALFASLRLSLTASDALTTLTAFHTFLTRHSLPCHRLALRLHNAWNADRAGQPLKRLLCSLGPHTLSVHQARGAASMPERSARWGHYITTLRALRLVTVDSDTVPKMLLLRSTPLHTLRIEDGKTASALWSYRHDSGGRHCAPGVVAMKPALFPALACVTYTGLWPPAGRVQALLEFLGGLRALRELRVTMMEGRGEMKLKLRDMWFRPSEEGRLYMQMVGSYAALTTAMAAWPRLERVEVGDWRALGGRDLEMPQGWENVPGTGGWRKVLGGEVEEGQEDNGSL
ncbi:hypothetical protein EDC01DRAFT_82433 [Geopyxis carbonaria]|nr:hypothetical protein EDC01DRAFT_82433 [Geopyxis carbonaria]